MFKRRWPVLFGPPLILLAVVLAVGVFALRADGEAKAAHALLLPHFSACASTDAARVGKAEPGTWWKTSDRLDGTGSIIARHLFVGHDASPSGRADLPVE